MDSEHLLEISLISAQDLQPPSGAWRIQTYALAWLDPTAKVCTQTDQFGGRNPNWNDRFVFRVPSASLHLDSPSGISIEIYAVGGWCLPDTILGTARLLLSDRRLLDRPYGTPCFSAVGIRRPSGRFRGILNVGLTVVSHVSALMLEALVEIPAIGYRELMGDVTRLSVERRRGGRGRDGRRELHVVGFHMCPLDPYSRRP